MFMKIYTQKRVTLGLRLQKRVLDDPCGGGGGGLGAAVGVTWVNFCWVCAAGVSLSSDFQDSDFLTFIALFQELTMKKNYNTLQIVKKGY